MATSKLKSGSYIKWNFDNGILLGKVNKIYTEKMEALKIEASEKEPFGEIELISGQITHQALADVSEITKEEYNSAVAELIENLTTKIEYKGKAMNELEIATNKIADLEAALAIATAEIATMKKSNEDVSAQLTATNTKLAEIEKDAQAATRVAELRTVEGLPLIAEKEEEAIAKVRDMTDDQYSFIKAAAFTSFKRLTDQRVTSKPALTDQTITDKTKLTEASVADVVDATKVATPAVDPAVIATAAVNGDAMQRFVSNILNKNKKNK